MHLFQVLCWLQNQVCVCVHLCSIGVVCVCTCVQSFSNEPLCLCGPHTKITHCMGKSRGVQPGFCLGQSPLSRSLFTLQNKRNKYNVRFLMTLFAAQSRMRTPLRDKHGCQTSISSVGRMIMGTLSRVWSVGPVQKPSDEEVGEGMNYPPPL